MKNTIKISALALALASLSTSAMAADGTGSATATIIAPLTVTNTTDLAFGEIAKPTDAGKTLVISSAGVISGDANYISGGQSKGTITIGGEDGKAYSITAIPDSSITDGTNTMTVTGFGITGSLTGRTLSSGTDSFDVGATLNIAQNQVAATYAGTYAVTVNYD